MTMEWQQQDDDSWNFGVNVRGIVRDIIAYVYFDEDEDSVKGGWRWGDLRNGRCGLVSSRISAINAAEKSLGIS